MSEVNNVRELIEDERTRVLVNVVPDMDAHGSCPFLLDRLERDLVRTASPEDWERARVMAEVQHRIFEHRIGSLEALLGVFARQPHCSIIARGFPDEEDNIESIALMALPADDLRVAYRALYELGWTRPAAA